MAYRRKHSRVENKCIGQLRRGTLVAPCKVVNMSEAGICLESRLLVKERDQVQLSVEYKGEAPLTCELEIVYVRALRIGAKITSITPEDQARFTHMLNEAYEDSFTRR